MEEENSGCKRGEKERERKKLLTPFSLVMFAVCECLKKKELFNFMRKLRSK